MAEPHLWEALRNGRIGFKFRRQEPIAGVVVDFYCAEARLAVEADGEQHAESVEYDRKRDAKIGELGIEVLRIPNVELYSKQKHRYEHWIRTIVAAFERRTGRAAFPNFPRVEESRTLTPDSSPMSGTEPEMGEGVLRGLFSPVFGTEP